jgi:hypothetical protein
MKWNPAWLLSELRRLIRIARLPSRPLRPRLAPAADAQMLAAATVTLRRMLDDVDRIEAELPDHEQAVSAAARSLITRSLAECRKPGVNVPRLAEDMKRVSELATAMRARILLAPLDRKSTLLN